MEANKRLILKLGAVLTGILLFLTFFSNTIYSFNLAGVTTDFPSDGVITRTARAEGTVDFAQNQFVYAETAGKITLLKEAGETAAAGDGLFMLTADLTDLHERLTAESNRLEKIRLEQAKAEADQAFQQSRLENLHVSAERPSDTPAPDTARFDYEMTRLTAEIAAAEEDYRSAQALQEAGILSRGELSEKADRLDSLRRELAQNKEQKEKALADYEQALAKAAAADRLTRDEQITAYETERKTLQKNIDDLCYQLEALALDAVDAQRTTERLRAQIDAGGVEMRYAEQTGIIREIPDGVEDSAHITQGQLVMRIGITEGNSLPYRAEMSFPDSADFLEPGMEVKLNIKSAGEYGLRATVERVGYANGRIRADVVFDAPSLTGGEKAEAVAEHSSELYGTVLPNSAIRKDDEGPFILYTERVKNTLLGYAYYARRMPINIFEQDERRTAFWMMTETDRPIIVNSDRPVAPGDRIRMVGGDELVEIR